MKGYEPRQSFADAETARRHDARGDEASAVALLAELAGEGPVLELGIGTGRLALPLAERGLRVDGIDFSESMVARLREKPGGDALRVVVGDFATVELPATYALVFVAWNTLFNVLTQEGQTRCFEKTARHLGPGGCFLVEAYTPDFLFGLPGGQAVEVEGLSPGETRLSLLRHDPSRQRLEQSHVSLSAQGVRVEPVVQRYVWPSELDLMARMAGLRLRERWADWRRAPFAAGSRAHVSVYAR